MPDFNWMLLLMVLAVSLVGGTASFLQQRRTKRYKKSGWLSELLCELFAAYSAGLSALFLGLWQDFHPALTCLVAMISASNGAGFMEIWRKLLITKIQNGDKNA